MWHIEIFSIDTFKQDLYMESSTNIKIKLLISEYLGLTIGDVTFM